MSTAEPDSISLRPAQADDAPVLAQLVNYAGESMPLYLWQGLATKRTNRMGCGKTAGCTRDGQLLL